jgi:hypothetical protein
MTQALNQQLLNIVLINKYDSISHWNQNFLKEIDNRNRFIKLFQTTLKEIEVNIPYWLKYFHGNWKEIKPSTTCAIMKEQININALKERLDKIESKKNSFYTETKGTVRELNEKIREERNAEKVLNAQKIYNAIWKTALMAAPWTILLTNVGLLIMVDVVITTK